MAMVFSIVPAFGLTASAENQTITLNVTDDAFVQAMYYEGGTTNPITGESKILDADSNTGSEGYLTAQGSGWGNYRNFYLQFEAQNINPKLIVSAKLKMVKAKKDDSVGCSINYYAIDTTFDENTLTWNNAPAEGAWLGWADLNDVDMDGIVELDVTDYVKSKVSAEKTTPIGIKIAFRNKDQFYAYSKEGDSTKGAAIEIVMASALADVTVNYVDGTEIVKTYTVKDRKVDSPFTPYAEDYCVDKDEKYLYTVGAKETVNVNATDNVINIPVTKYKQIDSVNLVTNGSFEDDSAFTDGISGWTTFENNALSDARYSFTNDASDAATAIETKNCTGNSDEETLKNTVSGLTAGNDYYAAIDNKGTTGERQFEWFSVKNNGTETRKPVGEFMNFSKDSFVTTGCVITMGENENEIAFEGTYFQDSHPIIDNFCVYKIKALEVSTPATAQDAVNSVKAPDSIVKGTGSLNLEKTVSDGVTMFTVLWQSDNTDVISTDGVCNSTDRIEKVTLQPTVMLENEVYYGAKTVVTVFPESLSVGDSMESNSVTYKVAGIVPEFDYDWVKRDSADGSTKTSDVVTTEVNGFKYTVFPALGGMSGNNTRGSVAITPGKTYMFRFYYGGLAFGGDESTDKFNKIFTTAGQYNDENPIDYVSGSATRRSAHTTANEWEKIESIFTASENANYLAFVYSWLDSGLMIGDVQLYELEEDTEANATITINYYYDDAKTELYKSVKKTFTKGNTFSFDAVEVLKDGTFYTTDAVSYEDVQENAEYDVVLTAVENRITASTTFSWNFKNNSRLTGFGGDHGDIKSDTNILTIGWNDPRGGVIAFDIKPESGKAFGNAELKMNVPYFGGGDPTLYAVDSSYLNSDNYSLNYDGSALTFNDAANTTPKIVADMGGYAIGTITGGGDQSVTFDLGEYFTKFPTADKVLIIALATSGQIYGYGNDAEKFGTMVPSLTYESMYTALGVQIEDGAQVRIGGGIDADGKVDVLEESGLRFAATVNGTDSMVADMVSGYIDDDNNYGILIYPSDVTITDFNAETDKFVAIPAQVFQDAEKTKFTAALTNLKVENYNRMFTAKPYVKKDGVYYTDDNKTERSVYQVAAGLLTDEAASGSLTENTVNVLNAYLNQVGVRLTYAADGTIGIRTEGVGAYTGVEFFTVASDGADGVYTITLTAKGNATFKNFWNEYVRVNNNHTQVVNGIGENAAISEDGKTLTFTFTPGNVK